MTPVLTQMAVFSSSTPLSETRGASTFSVRGISIRCGSTRVDNV